MNMESHKAEGSDQLRNASRRNVQKILARFGEKRVLLKEGGRTNRGLMKNLEPLSSALSNAGIDKLSPDDRDVEFTLMQDFLADRATEIFNADKLSFAYRQGMTSRNIIGDILKSSRERRNAGEVAEHLVGAKLALRFPDHEIRNSPVSAADDQTDEHGDFQLNDCVFHVTVSPNSGHYDKCQDNLAEGLRVFMLVPDMILAGTRQNADQQTGGRVSVESIESFVSQNVEELSDFDGGEVSHNLRMLLVMYNSRVAEVETDLSLQIRIPSVLGK